MRSAGAVDMQVGEDSVGIFVTDLPLHHRQVAQELHSPRAVGVNVWLLWQGERPVDGGYGL